MNPNQSFLSFQGWYLIDPASNLEGTQTRMRDWVKQAFPQWNGVIGKEPDAADALKQVRSLVSLFEFVSV